GRNLFRLCVSGVSYRKADSYLNLPGPSELLPRFLDFKQSINAHGDHGYIEISRQQSHSGSKRIDFAVRGVPTFWKDENAVTVVDSSAGITKTLAKARFAWQREEI